MEEVTSDENSDIRSIPSIAWNIELSKTFDTDWKAFSYGRLKQMLPYVTCAFRMLKYEMSRKFNRTRPVIDTLRHVPLKPMFGVPIGGIGCGSIGRGFKGEFCRFQLIPGYYEHSTAPANMFIATIRSEGKLVYQAALTTESNLPGLKYFNYVSSSDGEYYALYPLSWTVYRLPGVILTCRQLSPVIRHNYKDSSLPVATFSWLAENTGEKPIEVSITLLWQAGSSSNTFSCTGATFNSFQESDDHTAVKGVIIDQKLKCMPLTYVVGVQEQSGIEITTRNIFYPSMIISCRTLWNDLQERGVLWQEENPLPFDSNGACAVCAKFEVPAKSSKATDFVLVWHMPTVHFYDSSKVFKRYYTTYFEDTVNGASKIALYACKNLPNWVKSIKQWHDEITNCKNLSKSMKCALFNELYFVSDGGSVWFKGDSEDNTHVRRWGRYGILEGHEYLMYNTFDVYYYASIAIALLWPNLELSVMYDFGEAIPMENKAVVKFLNGDNGILKVANVVPHDLGAPDAQPWDEINAYNNIDTSKWKDLNIKFVILVYRDFYLTKDMDFLRTMWPLVKVMLNLMKKQDTDGDHIIDNTGADQTFDMWPAYGCSAYCGGLQLAALRVSIEMAKLLEEGLVASLTSWLQDAIETYNKKLWNGTYFNYDSSDSDHFNGIMASQLSGIWGLKQCGIDVYDIIPQERIKSVLQTIYDNNVKQFLHGTLGAVNGFIPKKGIDIKTVQSEESWFGITYSIASLMLFEGMNTEAACMIDSQFDTAFNRIGLGFQTPEAVNSLKRFRSLGYMRPLSIWSLLLNAGINQE